MKKMLIGFAAILVLAACSKSESADGANVEKDDPTEGVEEESAEGANPTNRTTVVTGDGTVKVNAGNTEVIVDKDGNKVTTGGVKIDNDGVTAGGTKVTKDGVKTGAGGGVKVNKDGTTTVGGVKVGKDGTVTIPSRY